MGAGNWQGKREQGEDASGGTGHHRPIGIPRCIIPSHLLPLNPQCIMPLPPPSPLLCIDPLSPPAPLSPPPCIMTPQGVKPQDMFVGPPVEVPPGAAADSAYSERFKRGVRRFLRDMVGGVGGMGEEGGGWA